MARAGGGGRGGAAEEVLARAMGAGGRAVKNYTRGEGDPGYFAQSLNVDGRDGQPCLQCEASLRSDRHGRSSTAYCPQCQR